MRPWLFIFAALLVVSLTFTASGVYTYNNNTFNFLITGPQPFATTNLTAKVSVTRVVLTGGQLEDVRQSVLAAPQN